MRRNRNGGLNILSRENNIMSVRKDSSMRNSTQNLGQLYKLIIQ